MIDEHDAEQDRTGEQGAAGKPVSSDAASANEFVTSDELDLAEDAGLGEAERALLRWALRQRQRASGEPLLPTGNEPLPPPETPAPRPEPTPVRPPPPRPATAPARGEDRQATPWERLHEAAEEAISALVAAGGPDPRDYASPRLDRRAKMLIAVALVVLFMVSVLGGFVGYRLTYRAASAGPEAAGRPAGIHAAAPATLSV